MDYEIASKRKQQQQQQSYLSPTKTERSQARLHPVLQLQQRIGNQSVLRLYGHPETHVSLKISQPGDRTEQEADRLAKQVMLMPDPQVPTAGVRSRPAAAMDRGAVASTSNAGGQPLPDSVRSHFEPRFGHDFSGVRVHMGAAAASSASDLEARAYTVGPDIVFGAGQYQLETSEGKRLLAHELSHVVQQTEAGRAGPDARVIQRQATPAAKRSTVAGPQLTQQLYDQAIASIAAKTAVNSTLLGILQKGKVGRTVPGVHSAASTSKVQAPAAQGSSGGGTPTPSVKFSFDFEISAQSTQLPTGAFAAFVDDQKNQTSFSGKVPTGVTITRLLKIITKAPPGGNTAADKLGEAIVHEGTHLLLAIDRLLSSESIPGLSPGMTGAQTAFERYERAAASSSLRSGLDASLFAEVSRVFTPAGATAPTISATDAGAAVANVIKTLLEERFSTDQQLAAYPRTVPNSTLAGAYLWDLLADETSKKPWPKGPGAPALVSKVAVFLDNVAATLNPPAPGSPGLGTSPTRRKDPLDPYHRRPVP